MRGERFERAIRRFDEENASDPRLITVNGRAEPQEVFFARKLTEWVTRLDPVASEELLLAARSQHLCRWKIPRSDYPMDRPGYLRWRTALKQFHAELSGKILADCGYSEETVRAVRELNLKKNFPADPASRVLEDALCLVFLENQLEDLAGRTEKEKILNALRKSWGKMTESARERALQLQYPPKVRDLLKEALQAGN